MARARIAASRCRSAPNTPTGGPLLVTEADYANLSLLDSTQLRRRLARAVRLRSDAMPRDVVTMNSRVLCTDLTNGERHVVSVVYPDDADPGAGRFSVITDAGMALLGASVGQTIEWGRADGKLQHVQLSALVYQPEQDLRTNLVLAL
jgi:regulator of nucleoside diphosphate kinase